MTLGGPDGATRSTDYASPWLCWINYASVSLKIQWIAWETRCILLGCVNTIACNWSETFHSKRPVNLISSPEGWGLRVGGWGKGGRGGRGGRGTTTVSSSSVNIEQDERCEWDEKDAWKRRCHRVDTVRTLIQPPDPPSPTPPATHLLPPGNW